MSVAQIACSALITTRSTSFCSNIQCIHPFLQWRSVHLSASFFPQFIGQAALIIDPILPPSTFAEAVCCSFFYSPLCTLNASDPIWYNPTETDAPSAAKTAISEPFILIGGVMTLHQAIEVAWCSVCWCYFTVLRWWVSEVQTLCWSRNNPFRLWRLNVFIPRRSLQRIRLSKHGFLSAALLTPLFLTTVPPSPSNDTCSVQDGWVDGCTDGASLIFTYWNWTFQIQNKWRFGFWKLV